MVENAHPLILKQYPIGEVPEKMEIDLEVPFPPPRKPKEIPENAVIRTSEKFDGTIKHLGYQSITFSQEELDSLGKAIPTDLRKRDGIDILGARGLDKQII